MLVQRGHVGVPRRAGAVEGLGLLPWSNAVHYGGEASRRVDFRAALAAGMCPGYAATDGAALHFEGTELAHVVGSRPDARAFRVEPAADGAVETELAVRFLGEPRAHLRGRLSGPAQSWGMPGPTIFAMGGGGFLTEPADAALERYVLDLAAPAEPRICFLPTASGDPQDAIVRFHAAFDPLPCRPSALDLFRLHGRDLDLRAHLLEQHIVYVGGGSMRNLLAIWHEHALDRILPEAWERGVALAACRPGRCAGSTTGSRSRAGRPSSCPASACCRRPTRCTGAPSPTAARPTSRRWPAAWSRAGASTTGPDCASPAPSSSRRSAPGASPRLPRRAPRRQRRGGADPGAAARRARVRRPCPGPRGGRAARAACGPPRPAQRLAMADWWELRRATNRKPSTYTCPLCGKRLLAMTEHALIVPEGDASRRRHAHLECVAKARARGELPTRSEWQRAQRGPREPLRARLRRALGR